MVVLISLLSAPSNLGLRPPQPGSVPGCAKAPEALREAGLYRRFAAVGATDAGVVLPGRYADDARPGVLRNSAAIIEHARRLADRIGELRAAGQVPLILGGDCSLLIGAGLALRRAGTFGLVHVDGHTDFRHPGNSAESQCASLAGEDLAAAVGLHWPAIADLDGLRPYFRPSDVVQAGCRADDEYLAETREVLGAVTPAAAIVADVGVVGAVLEVVARRGLAGYWLHVDVDVLDPSVLPAVDSPSPGGLTAVQLGDLLNALAPGAAGAQVTVFDPDLDPDGCYARMLTDVVFAGLAMLGRDL
jgi:arginase